METKVKGSIKHCVNGDYAIVVNGIELFREDKKWQVKERAAEEYPMVEV